MCLRVPNPLVNRPGAAFPAAGPAGATQGMGFARPDASATRHLAARRYVQAPDLPAMSELEFTPEDLALIVWACAPVVIPDPTPDYLQDFLALRLAERAPDTSTRIRMLSRDEMEQVGDFIRCAHGHLRC